MYGYIPKREINEQLARILKSNRFKRGEFSATRLDSSEFQFRKAIWHGQSIGQAVECALGSDAAFDPSKALAGLIASGLVCRNPCTRRE